MHRFRCGECGVVYDSEENAYLCEDLHKKYASDEETMFLYHIVIGGYGTRIKTVEHGRSVILCPFCKSYEGFPMDIIYDEDGEVLTISCKKCNSRIVQSIPFIPRKIKYLRFNPQNSGWGFSGFSSIESARDGYLKQRESDYSNLPTFTYCRRKK